MTISANFQGVLMITETLAGAFVSPTDRTVTFGSANLDTTADRITGTLTASTTVPATKATAYALTIGGPGTASIDFTALPGLTSEETIIGTGLKVQAVMFRNPTTNANTITLTEGASNGHPLFGAAFSVILSPGQWILAYLHDTGTDVASGDRIIDVVGTAAQVLQIVVVLG